MEQRKTYINQGALELRESRQEDGKTLRTISGYAIRFNEDSVEMGCWQRFVEQIAPSCVTDEVLAESDVKMTLFHNREKLLARWNKGKGSLRLAVDTEGVRFEFDTPDTELGRFCAEGVQRGDLSGCSFTFAPQDYIIREDEDGTAHVTHTRFAGLYEMTIGTDPAYPTTSVEGREFAESVAKEIDRRKEQAKHVEREELDTTAAQERERAERARRQRLTELYANELGMFD